MDLVTMLQQLPDPQINWEKIMCPFCGEPSGPKSRCEEKAKDGKVRKTEHPKLGKLPIFGENCVFKQENLWQIHTNYPISEPLINVLTKVQGIDRILPIKPYTLQIVIAKLFSEEQVQKNVNMTYRAFAKEIQVLSNKDASELESTHTVTMPNGIECAGISEDSKRILSSSFDGLVFRKDIV